MSIQNHSYCEAKSAPSSSYCYGRQTRLAYVVSIWLWRYKQQRESQKHGEVSIKLVYEAVRKALRLSATKCMVCSGGGSAKLHRPTICGKKSCLTVYLRSDLDVRMQDVRSDGRAFDLLLSAVFATASGGDLRLLPNLPDRVTDLKKLVGLLKKLPSAKKMADMPELSLGLRSHGERAQLLLSWMCTAYRSFLITARGRYNIPNMPNVHQFLLVNAKPELEARFAAHNALQPRHILYHGTSMARLYAILTEDARILSGSDLQVHGAVYGKGIYLAREPTTAWVYAKACSSIDGTSFFSSRPDFQDSEVVLGCEHAGNDTNVHGRGIHVITDESRVMVRYIFVYQPGTPAPRARDINPAMMSTFNYLRSSAVGAES